MCDIPIFKRPFRKLRRAASRDRGDQPTTQKSAWPTSGSSTPVAAAAAAASASPPSLKTIPQVPEQRGREDPPTPAAGVIATVRKIDSQAHLDPEEKTTPPPDLAFIQALKAHEDNLAPAEKAAFLSSKAENPDELIRQVQELDAKHHKGSLSRAVGPRVQKVMVGMNMYMGVIGALISYTPTVSGLVVAGLQCVIQLGIRFFEFFDSLASMMETLENHVSYLSKYAKSMFQDSEDIREALARTYGDLLDFFVQARRVFTDSEGNVSRWTSFKVFFRMTWQPFEENFAGIKAKFLANAEIVTREAQVHGLITDDVERQRIRMREQQEDKEREGKKRREVFTWLSDLDFEDVHETHFQKRFGQTGNWLLNDPGFTDWQDSPESGLLWVHGTPGSGKTVLCSLVLESLTEITARSTGTTGISFAYCNYSLPSSQQNPSTFIATFIKQLSRCCPRIPEPLEKLFNTHNKDARNPSHLELRQLFLEVAAAFEKVYVVVDALDEFDPRQRESFLLFLCEIIKFSGGCIKVFITSRKEIDIERAFTDVPTIALESTRSKEDIEEYVEGELERRIEERILKLKDLSLKDGIYSALVEKADGMFLWVKFQLDTLCSQTSDRHIRKTLQNLPATMDETYTRCLASIEKKSKLEIELAKRIFMWITHAERPMKLGEISEAIAMELDMETSEDIKDSIVSDFNLLITVCGGMVTIDWQNVEPNSTVRFVHYTVQEFLMAQGNGSSAMLKQNSQLAHEEIAQMCIKYMMIKYSEPPEENQGHWDTFKNYSSQFWHHHVQVLNQLSEDVWVLLYRFISSGELFFKTIRLFQARTSRIGVQKFTPSTIAMVLDLPLALSRLIQENLDTSDPTENGLEAIHWAAEVGSLKGVEWLLEKGVNINGMSAYGSTPLFAAIVRQNKELVQLLLSKGADTNVRGGGWGSPLQGAARWRNKDIIQLLLDNGADVNLRYGIKSNPLQAVAALGEEELVRLLLEKGADINAQGGEHGSVLQAAFASGNERLVRYLLEKGAEVTVQGKTLAATAARGSIPLIELLLEMGCDVNSKGERQGSVLKSAIWSGNKKVVEFLLQKGAKVDLPEVEVGYYGSALNTAALKGNVEIMQLLLDSGAEVNKRCGNFGAPLHSAVWSENPMAVKLLLDNGADPNARMKDGANALQVVVAKANLPLTKLLLDYGADVNQRGGPWGCAMEAARVRANDRIRNMLQEHGGVNYLAERRAIEIEV